MPPVNEAQSLKLRAEKRGQAPVPPASLLAMAMGWAGLRQAPGHQMASLGGSHAKGTRDPNLSLMPPLILGFSDCVVLFSLDCVSEQGICYFPPNLPFLPS